VVDTVDEEDVAVLGLVDAVRKVDDATVEEAVKSGETGRFVEVCSPAGVDSSDGVVDIAEVGRSVGEDGEVLPETYEEVELAAADNIVDVGELAASKGSEDVEAELVPIEEVVEMVELAADEKSEAVEEVVDVHDSVAKGPK
jgi:hypothetical protein